MRWAEAHPHQAGMAFGVTGALILGIPWAIDGGNAVLVAPVSIGFALVIAAVVRSELSPLAQAMRALNMSERRMISEALRRGQAVEKPACAALAAEVAAANQRTNRLIFLGAPVFLFVFQVLYLLHLGRSFAQSVSQWQGIALAALTGLLFWNAWRQWATRLRRAEELNLALAGREDQAP